MGQDLQDPQDHGASLRDRAGGLRPEPATQSQPEALVPSAEYERDLARRLHAAAIANGKAEAELERTPLERQPAAFRMLALAKTAQASIAWLRVYFEAAEYFQGLKDAASGIETEGQDRNGLGAKPESPTGKAGDAHPSGEQSNDH